MEDLQTNVRYVLAMIIVWGILTSITFLVANVLMYLLGMSNIPYLWQYCSIIGAVWTIIGLIGERKDGN